MCAQSEKKRNQDFARERQELLCMVAMDRRSNEMS